MKLWDISRTLEDKLAPWPGDVPFHYRMNLRIADGATVNLGSIGLSVHNGTHADAPFHFERDGEKIDRMPPDAYVGRAVVVDLTKHFVTKTDGLIELEHLQSSASAIAETSRILIKTNVWRDSSVFPKQIPVLASDVPPWLQARGVRLIGFDLPSVDPIEAKVLHNHHALGRAGIVIIESLDLGEVETGVYNLAALPLRIAGADGAPVRAVLWRD
jgi:arylformamidase